MKMIKKCANSLKYGLIAVPLSFIAKSALATDLLSAALEGDVQDSLGGDAKFWKIFTFVSIVLATGAAAHTKNPMVFVGVLAVAFIPTFLIKTFVF